MGWFSDAISSVSDFISSPVATVSNTVQHISDVASNNPLVTAAAVAGAAYATGGGSLFVDAGGSAILGASDAAAAAAADELASAAAADVAGGLIPAASLPSAASTFSLSQVAGAAGDTIKALGVVSNALALANQPINASSLTGRVSYPIAYSPPASATAANNGSVAGAAVAGGIVQQAPAPLSLTKIALWGCGAFLLIKGFTK